MSEAVDTYLGLEADEAERRAREHGWDRVRSVAPGTILTMEYIKGRINFEVDGGKVVRCWKGLEAVFEVQRQLLRGLRLFLAARRRDRP